MSADNHIANCCNDGTCPICDGREEVQNCPECGSEKVYVVDGQVSECEECGYKREIF